MVFHQLLDEVHLGGAEGASVLLALAAEAVEVVVEVAAGVAALLVGERFAALAAVDGPLEVHAVYSGLLSALVSGLPNLLNTSELLLGDEGFVLAPIFDAAVHHHAHVVAVLQDAVDV
ncbi:MAG: hypothetical protein Q7T56_19610 [Nocardioidaceae bacterium]|nr:hypothetical protein [Nocardioidaceae bacterium]